MWSSDFWRVNICIISIYKGGSNLLICEGKQTTAQDGGESLQSFHTLKSYSIKFHPWPGNIPLVCTITNRGLVLIGWTPSVVNNNPDNNSDTLNQSDYKEVIDNACLFIKCKNVLCEIVNIVIKWITLVCRGVGLLFTTKIMMMMMTTTWLGFGDSSSLGPSAKELGQTYSKRPQYGACE